MTLQDLILWHKLCDRRHRQGEIAKLDRAAFRLLAESPDVTPIVPIHQDDFRKLVDMADALADLISYLDEHDWRRDPPPDILIDNARKVLG